MAVAIPLSIFESQCAWPGKPEQESRQINVFLPVIESGWHELPPMQLCRPGEKAYVARPSVYRAIPDADTPEGGQMALERLSGPWYQGILRRDMGRQKDAAPDDDGRFDAADQGGDRSV